MAETKLEQIGQVNLDLTYYPGEDYYCDGAIEDEMLKIARDYSTVEYPRIIEERCNWEILYHFSKQRENIVEWLPIRKDMKVLEVGSGCGAITGALAEKAGSVTCIDLSKKRSMINAYRHMDCDNVTIHVGNFQDIEPSLPQDYDYVCLIGVFEYGQAYIGSEHPYEEFLNILKRHLKKDGHLAIAIENKFGLKYWAGCKEDHLGTYFSGIEGYPEGGVVRTFTRPGLEKILNSCGISEYSFYYPYPDYKLMTTVYSDEYLPKLGELSNNRRNFDRNRMQLFDEKKVYDSILEDGLFPLYSNSYMVVTGEPLEIKYAKYSNDRQPEYRIKTEILKTNVMGYADADDVDSDAKKDWIVRKHPLSKEAGKHIENMELAYQNLKQRYQGSDLKINRCKMVQVRDQMQDEQIAEGIAGGTLLISDLKPYAQFEFLDGVTLEELMDAALAKENMDLFEALFDRYLEFVAYHQEMPVADFDMIFSNLLITRKDPGKAFDPFVNANWTLIDYEWTFGKQMDYKELAFRAVLCYLLEDEKRDKLNLGLIMDKLGISEKDAEEYRAQELSFQRFVTGNRRSMTEMRDLIGRKIYEPEKWIEKMQKAEEVSRIQIYEDKGNGLSEEESYFLKEEQILEDPDGMHLVLQIQPGTRLVRIDPAFTSCSLTMKSILLNDSVIDCSGKSADFTTNGTKLDDTDTYVFTTEDPNLLISLENVKLDTVGILEVTMDVVILPAAMAQHMEAAARKRIRL